ncbi:MAG: D-amino acid aminotransferase [Burkholderiales bacterium]|nr:D-amino acid aminotransferase [Burkholderiales bacterium]OJX06235.1 MAG: D-amino acid aminotransferase [Burkholderiales bacterium 70-64]
MAQTVYLNGEFMPLEEARVPVLDRGFIFGDGVYEVVPIYGGRTFRWPQHLARLERSLAAIGIANPLDREGWTELVEQIIGYHEWADQFVYMQVTRGVARRDHAFPKDARPTVFAMSSPLVLPSAAQVEQGVDAITLPDERWLHCDIKTTSLLGNVLARQAAVQAGAAECVMFRDGFLTEGAASNIWVARGDRLFAPPRDNLVLEGVRYGLIEELCRKADIRLQIRRILREEVLAADELMLSSATKEVLPITRLDGRPVGAGRPGPVFARLHKAYQDAKAGR